MNQKPQGPVISTVVWIDRDHAKIFEISDERMERIVLHARTPDHHTHRLDADEKESPKFYEEVSQRLGDATKVLILGPGIARKHFHTFLEERHPDIAKKVIGSETVDHPTDHQIAAFATRFFRLNGSSGARAERGC